MEHVSLRGLLRGSGFLCLSSDPTAPLFTPPCLLRDSSQIVTLPALSVPLSQWLRVCGQGKGGLWFPAFVMEEEGSVLLAEIRAQSRMATESRRQKVLATGGPLGAAAKGNLVQEVENDPRYLWGFTMQIRRAFSFVKHHIPRKAISLFQIYPGGRAYSTSSSVGLDGSAYCKLFP